MWSAIYKWVGPCGGGEPAQHPSVHLLLQRCDLFRCQPCGLGEVDFPVLAYSKRTFGHTALNVHMNRGFHHLRTSFQLRRTPSLRLQLICISLERSAVMDVRGSLARNGARFLPATRRVHNARSGRSQ